MKITLCGSTRFFDVFEEWNIKLTLAGHIVYSLAAFGREITDTQKLENQPLFTAQQKQTLDLVHLNKIANSEAVVVLNPMDYIGFSTRREIEWAYMLRKEVFFLVKTKALEDFRRPIQDLYGSD